MVEIGSYNKNCKKTGTYQSACCDSDHKSMTLYTKGEWGKYPMCEETSSCPAGDSKKSNLLGSANAGSGQAICNAYYKGQVLPKDPPNERKFCYDSSNKKERFSDCVWYGGVGTMLPGAPKNWCLSGCPSNRVRIGMGYDKKCANYSYRALCCVPNMVDIIQVENPKLQEYRDALEEYTKAPRCEVPSPFSKRELHALGKREQKYPYDVTGHVLLALLTGTAGSNAMNDLMEEIWNKAMGDRFSNLHFPSLRDFAMKLPTWATQGPIAVSQKIMCNLNSWNERASGKGSAKTLVCYDTTCSEGECQQARPGARKARSVPSLNLIDHSYHRRHHHHHHNYMYVRQASNETSLEKRREPYYPSLVNPDGNWVTIELLLPPVRLNEIAQVPRRQLT
jgi:chitinase